MLTRRAGLFRLAVARRVEVRYLLPLEQGWWSIEDLQFGIFAAFGCRFVHPFYQPSRTLGLYSILLRVLARVGSASTPPV